MRYAVDTLVSLGDNIMIKEFAITLAISTLRVLTNAKNLDKNELGAKVLFGSVPDAGSLLVSKLVPYCLEEARDSDMPGKYYSLVEEVVLAMRSFGIEGFNAISRQFSENLAQEPGELELTLLHANLLRLTVLLDHSNQDSISNLLNYLSTSLQDAPTLLADLNEDDVSNYFGNLCGSISTLVSIRYALRDQPSSQAIDSQINELITSILKVTTIGGNFQFLRSISETAKQLLQVSQEEEGQNEKKAYLPVYVFVLGYILVLAKQASVFTVADL